MRFRLSVLVLSLPIVLVLPDHTLALSPAQYPGLQSFIQEMVSKHGLSEPEMDQWFKQTRIRQDVLSAVRAPKEALPWYEYRKLFVTGPSARRGKTFWKTNAKALSKAQREYGVDPATIVAIIGVETQYGRNTGRFPIMDALTTLMLEYPPRREFFRRELEEYLLLSRELKLDPLELRGSYAGAIGVPQFMPSSYRQYAIDFDGDDERNIVSGHADAIGSVANFLKQHGWQRDGLIIQPLQLQKDLINWLEKLGNAPTLPLRYLLGYGVLPMEYNDADESAALVTLEGEAGPLYHIGYNNFYVITHYNRSQNYAMAVFELSQWIRKLYRMDQP